MDTSQLLLVSSLGLGVNLFGMFAMGGHHHVSKTLVLWWSELTSYLGWPFSFSFPWS